MKFLFLFLISVFVFLSCNEDKKDKPGGTADSGQSNAMLSADSAKIFLLPGPLQASSLMLRYCPSPEINLLSSTAASGNETEYNVAMNLGICIADAGYCGLYNQRQLTLNHLSKAESLIKKLRLDNFSASFIARVRNNLDNRDSLSLILLSLYEKTQAELNATGKERVAFFITSGCFIENLNITLSSKQLGNTPAFPQLLGQQSQWLDNLTESLTYLPQDNDTQDLYSTFYTLQHYFKPVSLSRNKNIVTGSMFPDDLEALRKKTEQLRNEIIAG